MISSFRKNLRSNEAGQAIILGAVSLLVMAVTIMVTIQLGWTIKEKITIQHAADNAAYTTAAVVARSLNFTAFMNRAMVAHYVTAMSFQSFIGQIEALMMMFGFTASGLLNIGAFFGVLSYIPYVGSIALPIAKLIGGAGHFLNKTVGDNLRSFIDKFADPFLAGAVLIFGRYVNLISFYAQVILGRGLTTAALVKTSGSEWSGNFYSKSIKETAGQSANSELSGIGYNLIASIHGVLSYQSFFSKYSQKLNEKSSSTEEKRAQRLMTELANASREGKNGVKWETGREISANSFLTNLLPNGEGGNVKDTISTIAGWLGNAMDGIFPNSVGATMLVDPMTKETFSSTEFSNNKTKDKKNYTFGNIKHRSNFSTGSAMVSADYVEPFGNFIEDLFETIFGSGFIAGIVKDFVGALPGVETSKIVGVQSFGIGENGKENRFHCKYMGFQTSLGSLKGFIEKAIKKAKDKVTQCEDEYDEEGNLKEKEEDCSKSPSTGESNLEELENQFDEIDDAAYDLLKGLLYGVPGNIHYDCVDEGEERHKFGGIVKYVSFNIEGFEEDMNYPSFLAAVNKVSKFPIEVGLGFDEGEPLKMQSIGDVQGKKCDDENEFKGCLTEYQFNHVNPENLFKGLHAWARSQVYYHRPGTWTEPPNLFNPFWKPKLSPMAPYLGGDALSNLGQSLGDSFSDKIKNEEFASDLTDILSGTLGMLPELILLH